MTEFVDKYKVVDRKVLDVGSFDVNGTYRPLFKNYIGLDIEVGKNVDIVSTDLYKYPFEDNTFDVVISGNTIEHLEESKIWVRELARITRDLVCIICPVTVAEHRYPIDCWRIYPDGMRFLLKQAGLEVLECRLGNDTCDVDTIGIGRKV